MQLVVVAVPELQLAICDAHCYGPQRIEMKRDVLPNLCSSPIELLGTPDLLPGTKRLFDEMAAAPVPFQFVLQSARDGRVARALTANGTTFDTVAI
ncbi:hypothetical protein F4560_001789 [Saccharothrix ecbatanensis]|uniref:Uncharacterized protein n=1 Tax=Saccharothrix ecbatanensis TaxID=1105145 RepID=A0A7W9HHD9_9PSEU|nr:hypothetical protein [Saccharothrix ecbatanensis]MBB5802021.1 hypothetical protein [Saccharothrix ecbatanensis]